MYRCQLYNKIDCLSPSPQPRPSIGFPRTLFRATIAVGDDVNDPTTNRELVYVQLGNHDNSRVASRSNPMLVDGLHMIQTLLPGTVVTYYGDELGLMDTNVRWDQTVDPAGLNVGPYRYLKFSRDPVRTPFPWDSSFNAGKRESNETSFTFVGYNSLCSNCSLFCAPTLNVQNIDVKTEYDRLV